MAMQVNGNYGHSRTDYAERVKEKQAAERAEKAKEAEKAAEGKSSGKLSEPQDEYISSEKSGKKPTGLYRVGQDENGNRNSRSSQLPVMKGKSGNWRKSLKWQHHLNFLNRSKMVRQAAAISKEIK